MIGQTLNPMYKEPLWIAWENKDYETFRVLRNLDKLKMPNSESDDPQYIKQFQLLNTSNYTALKRIHTSHFGSGIEEALKDSTLMDEFLEAHSVLSERPD